MQSINLFKIVKNYPGKIKIKHFAISLTVLFALSLLPLLAVGMYNHPSADDFSYSASCRQIWLNSHSIWQVCREAFAIVIDRYMSWQGTYATIFFMAVQPAIWSESFYAFVPFIMLSALLFSVCYFCSGIVRKCMRGTASESIILSLLILFPFIQCMPNVTEGLFWFNGTVNYIIPFTATLILAGLVIRLLFPSARKSRFAYICAVICAFFSAGGNPVVGLVTCVFLISLILLLFIVKRKTGKKAVYILSVLYLFFFAVNIAAPGNFVRSSKVTGMHPIKAVLVSFRYALSYPVEEWLDWTVIACLLLAVPFLWKLVRRSSFRFPCPILVAVYSYCLFSSAFTPNLYATGNINAGRIQNLIFLLFLLLLFINTGYILGWLCRKFEVQKETEGNHWLLTGNQCLFTMTAVFALFFGIMLTVIPNPEYYASSEALRELASDEAQAYDREIRERIALLNGPEKQITLNTLEHQPELLFFSDITTNPNDWTNLALSRYYGKKSVFLTEKNGLPVNQ